MKPSDEMPQLTHGPTISKPDDMIRALRYASARPVDGTVRHGGKGASPEGKPMPQAVRT